MKFVIYDEETLEPITFINVPGLDRAALETMGYRVRLEAPRPMATIIRSRDESPPAIRSVATVELTFERIVRYNRAGEKVEGFMCFTDAVGLAATLKPDWMIGQRSAVDYLAQQNDRLTEMLMKLMTMAR